MSWTWAHADSLLDSAVEDLRYQHLYHPVPLQEKCPALHRVIEQISAGLFNDAEVYEPYVYSTITLSVL
jgi:starch phosphorylase